MKKIALMIAAAAAVLITFMVIWSLNKSGGNIVSPDDSSGGQEEISSVADMEEVDILEGCELSEEEMTQVINNYYESLETILAQNGDNAELNLKIKKDGVFVYVNDESEPRLEWGSVKEAYSFLYSQGQVDKAGNILVNQES